MGQSPDPAPPGAQRHHPGRATCMLEGRCNGDSDLQLRWRISARPSTRWRCCGLRSASQAAAAAGWPRAGQGHLPTGNGPVVANAQALQLAPGCIAAPSPSSIQARGGAMAKPGTLKVTLKHGCDLGTFQGQRQHERPAARGSVAQAAHRPAAHMVDHLTCLRHVQAAGSQLPCSYQRLQIWGATGPAAAQAACCTVHAQTTCIIERCVE